MRFELWAGLGVAFIYMFALTYCEFSYVRDETAIYSLGQEQNDYLER